jgi:hypothetical protein
VPVPGLAVLEQNLERVDDVLQPWAELVADALAASGVLAAPAPLAQAV